MLENGQILHGGFCSNLRHYSSSWVLDHSFRQPNLFVLRTHPPDRKQGVGIGAACLGLALAGLLAYIRFGRRRELPNDIPPVPYPLLDGQARTRWKAVPAVLVIMQRIRKLQAAT